MQDDTTPPAINPLSYPTPSPDTQTLRTWPAVLTLLLLAALIPETIITFNSPPLFLLTNPMPNCSSLDNALLTRINIMPFKVRWQRHGEVLNDNKHLPLGDTWWVEEAMEDERVRKYLLRWLIEGCVEYMREGFGEVPTRCFESLGAYKEEADTIATWMDEREVVLDGGAKTLVGDLYASYKDYALGAGHYVLSTVSFVRRLTAKYPDKLKKAKLTANKAGLIGIRFNR